MILPLSPSNLRALRAMALGLSFTWRALGSSYEPLRQLERYLFRGPDPNGVPQSPDTTRRQDRKEPQAEATTCSKPQGA
jgi:hypothetical protein